MSNTRKQNSKTGIHYRGINCNWIVELRRLDTAKVGKHLAGLNGNTITCAAGNIHN